MNRKILFLITASAVASFATVAQEGDKEPKKRLEQAAEKVGDLGGDDLIVNAIIRASKKQERMNKLLEEQGSKHRVTGIEVENAVPPKIVFTVTHESK